MVRSVHPYFPHMNHRLDVHGLVPHVVHHGHHASGPVYRHVPSFMMRPRAAST